MLSAATALAESSTAPGTISIKQQGTTMVAAPIDLATTVNAIVEKIYQGQEEITANELQELQAAAIEDSNHEVSESYSTALSCHYWKCQVMAVSLFSQDDGNNGPLLT
jgi:hypothetical protein